MQEYCQVCGSPISANNRTGIGMECARAIASAKNYELKVSGKYQAEWMLFITAKMQIVLDSCKTNRSFAYKFSTSIIGQIAEKGFVSEKQLNICKSLVEDFDKKWDDTVSMLREDVEVNREMIEKARQFNRNRIKNKK